MPLIRCTLLLTGTKDDQINTEDDVRAVRPVSFDLFVPTAFQVAKLAMSSLMRVASMLHERPPFCEVVGMAKSSSNASSRQRIEANSTSHPASDLGRSSDFGKRVCSSRSGMPCVALRFEYAVGVRAFGGMKPSEQVYSQVVEREQFRDTTKDNEGGDGEVHHATANCQPCHTGRQWQGQKLLPDAAQAWSSSAIAGTYKMSEKSMLELERCGYRSLATGCMGFAKG